MTLKQDSPFDRLKPKLRGLAGVYGRYMAMWLVVTFLFGAFWPLGVVALLLTISLPILALVLWGRSLDEELGWMDEDEGPW